MVKADKNIPTVCYGSPMPSIIPDAPFLNWACYIVYHYSDLYLYFKIILTFRAFTNLMHTFNAYIPIERFKV